MARFNCKLPAAGTRASAQVVAEALSAMQREDTAAASDTPSGPGWFDSSRELVRGLEVTESAPGDAALNEWVRLCFAR
jgi:hypothetical protein